MKRKGVFWLVAVVFLLMATCPVHGADAEFKLIYECVYPKGHMRFLVVDDILDRIEAKSNGRIYFERHYGGEPVGKKEAMTALTRGAIDLLTAYPTYYDGKIAIGDWQQTAFQFQESWEDCWDLGVNGRVAGIMDEVYSQNRPGQIHHLHTRWRRTTSRSPRSPRRSETAEDFKGTEDSEAPAARPRSPSSCWAVRR